MIDFTLTEEQRALQELARNFAKKEIIPVALKYDKEPFVPDEIVKRAHAAGLMNMTTPREYGGHGMGQLEASLMNEEILAGCAGIGGMIGINSLACGAYSGRRIGRAEASLSCPSLRCRGNGLFRLDRARSRL